MASPEQEPLTRHDLEAKIVKRCWEDDAFRREFTSDPAGTFVKYTETPRANLPQIFVHEEPAGSWHIVLPAKPVNAAELSDEELEQVAGGFSVSLVISVYATYAITAGLLSAGVTAGAAITGKKGW